MAVNGTGKDRRTGKELPDSTSWSVKRPGTGEVLKTKDRKTDREKQLSGLTAAEAFSAARGHLRRTGEWAAVVRS